MAKSTTLNTEAQPDLPETVDPLLQAQTELAEANELIATLQTENVKLFESNEDLERVVTAGLKSTLESTPETALTRNDVIKAMLPTIRKEYASSDAKALVTVVDDICRAFGV